MTFSSTAVAPSAPPSAAREADRPGRHVNGLPNVVALLQSPSSQRSGSAPTNQPRGARPSLETAGLRLQQRWLDLALRPRDVCGLRASVRGMSQPAVAVEASASSLIVRTMVPSCGSSR